MSEFHSLISKFKENQDEVSFILGYMDLCDGLGPLRVADPFESLGDAKKLLRSMAVILGNVSRNRRDDMASMTAD